MLTHIYTSSVTNLPDYKQLKVRVRAFFIQWFLLNTQTQSHVLSNCFMNRNNMSFMWSAVKSKFHST